MHYVSTSCCGLLFKLNRIKWMRLLTARNHSNKNWKRHKTSFKLAKKVTGTLQMFLLDVVRVVLIAGPCTLLPSSKDIVQSEGHWACEFCKRLLGDVTCAYYDELTLELASARLSFWSVVKDRAIFGVSLLNVLPSSKATGIKATHTCFPFCLSFVAAWVAICSRLVFLTCSPVFPHAAITELSLRFLLSEYTTVLLLL